MNDVNTSKDKKSASRSANHAKLDISRIDLNLFVVFEAVYRLQNLTRASEELCLSQPAVSHALSRLRESVNDELFLRSGRKMVATPFSKLIISRVRDALAQLRTALSESLVFDPEVEKRTFTFACHDVLEASALPILMKALQQLAPNIELRSVRLDRKNIETALLRGEIDFAADVLLATSKQIKNKIFGSESLAVVMGKQHPLAKKVKIAGKISLQQYLDCQHILVSSRPEGLGLEDLALSKIAKQRDIHLRCQHYFAANRVVAQTSLLVTMPKSYALSLAAYEKNIVLEIPFKAPAVNVHLYWHETSEQDPAIVWFLENIMTQLMA